jgi:hypothetical protein
MKDSMPQSSDRVGYLVIGFLDEAELSSKTYIQELKRRLELKRTSSKGVQSGRPLEIRSLTEAGAWEYAQSVKSFPANFKEFLFLNRFAAQAHKEFQLHGTSLGNIAQDRIPHAAKVILNDTYPVEGIHADIVELEDA